LWLLTPSQKTVTTKTNIKPKSATAMLEDLAAEIQENTSLLELIFKNSPDMGETDNALSCLLRSMLKTGEKAYGYIEALEKSTQYAGDEK